MRCSERKEKVRNDIFMDSTEGMKEVYFDQYCEKCKNQDLEEDKEPCCDCLNEPVNQYSHKPVKYEKK